MDSFYVRSGRRPSGVFTHHSMSPISPESMGRVEGWYRWMGVELAFIKNLLWARTWLLPFYTA